MSIKFVEPEVLALLAPLIAIDLARGLDLEEQNVAGNFIIDIGQILLTIAAAEEARKKAQEEAKAKEEEAKAKEEEKKGEPAKAEEKKAEAAKAKAEEDDILIGRAGHARLYREQEALRRQLRALERRVAELAGER